MGDHHPAEVTGAHAGAGERLDDGRRRGLGTGLDEGRLRPLDQESGGEPLDPPEQGVELLQPRGDLLHGPAGYPTRGEELAGASGAMAGERPPPYGDGEADGDADADGVGTDTPPAASSWSSSVMSALMAAWA